MARRQPMVVRAPARLLRAWAWGLLLAVAAALVTAAVVAPPRFVAASEDAALQEVRAATEDDAFRETTVDLRVSWDGVLPPATRELLDDELDGLPGHGAPVSTVFGSGPERTTEPVVLKGDQQVVATLWARDGALDTLASLDGATPAPAGEGRGGVWLPEAVAAELDAGPGDRVRLGIRSSTERRPASTVAAVVAGVFPTPDDGPLPAEVVADGVDLSLLPVNLSGDDEQRLVVTDDRTADALLQRMGDSPLHVEDAALEPGLVTCVMPLSSVAARSAAESGVLGRAHRPPVGATESL